MITYALVVAALVLLFGSLIHLVYKYVFRRGKYGGVTPVESLIICIGSIPGLAGCAVGWAGFGFPLPLIIGLPLELIFITNENCGWSQSLIFSDPYLTKKFASFPAAWLIANLVVLGMLYYLNQRSVNSVDKSMQPGSTRTRR